MEYGRFGLFNAGSTGWIATGPGTDPERVSSTRKACWQAETERPRPVAD